MIRDWSEWIVIGVDVEAHVDLLLRARERLGTALQLWVLGFGFWGVGFGVWGSRFGAWGWGVGVWGLEFGD